MNDFMNPVYHHEVWTAVVYGLYVVVGMVVAAGLFTVLAGGTAALGWEAQRKAAEH